MQPRCDPGVGCHDLLGGIGFPPKSLNNPSDKQQRCDGLNDPHRGLKVRQNGEIPHLRMTARKADEGGPRKCEVEIVNGKHERNCLNDGKHQENMRASASTKRKPPRGTRHERREQANGRVDLA
jgi:hypothetical protein